MGKKDKRAEEIFKVILMHNFPKYNKGQTTDPGNTESTKPDKSPNNKPRRSISKLQKAEDRERNHLIFKESHKYLVPDHSSGTF